MQLELPGVLLISLIGMGLVFGAIVLFWALIRLLVGLAGDGQSAMREPAAATEEREMKRLAAATAVSVALAERDALSEPQPFPLPPTALVSTWQAVLRARQLAQRRRAR